MTERKATTLNISKALLDVSLAALAAIGCASNIMWLAGATALPTVGFAASDTPGPLPQKNKNIFHCWFHVGGLLVVLLYGKPYALA